MHKQCFIIFIFIFCLRKLCILRDHEKRKKNSPLMISYRRISISTVQVTSNSNCSNILFLNDEIKMCLHSFICLLMAYRFICVMCFFPKNSFIFFVNKTDAHICFTEYVLSIYCVKRDVT